MKLFGIPQWKRFVIGIFIALLGLGMVLADAIVGVLTRNPALHMLNSAMGIVIAWTGGWIADPKWTIEAVHQLVAAIKDVLPSLSRATTPWDPAGFTVTATNLPPASSLPPRPQLTDHDEGVL